MKLEGLVAGHRVDLHVAFFTIAAISYGMLLITYIKHVHNRPYPAGLSDDMKKANRVLRRYWLGLFAILGAPVLGIFIKNTLSPMLKDIISIEVLSGPSSQSSQSNSSVVEDNSSNSGLFLILSKLRDKIPN